MSQSDHGVLFIATGAPYVRGAVRSARSIARHSPDLPCFLFHDEATRGLIETEAPGVFQGHGEVESPHRRSKVDYIGRSPFARTLYLDSDTEVCGPLDDVFRLLDRFDVAATHAPLRYRAATMAQWRDDIPACFPQFNGGIILYNLEQPNVRRLMEDWRDAYHATGFHRDQVTLRELLWRSDLRIATLPPEYNVRFKKYLLVWKAEEARPVILHFREFNRVRPAWQTILSPWRILRKLKGI